MIRLTCVMEEHFWVMWLIFIKWIHACQSGWALYHGALNRAQTFLSLLYMPSQSPDWGQRLIGLDARQRKWEAAAQWQKQWPSTQPSSTVYGCAVPIMTHFLKLVCSSQRYILIYIFRSLYSQNLTEGVLLFKQVQSEIRVTIYFITYQTM